MDLNAAPNPKSHYYTHLHHLRGFAILCIVAIHSWALLANFPNGFENPKSESGKIVSAVVETFFHNATIYFAVISGILFSLVLKRYSWPVFYTKKLKHVVLPYILFSVPYLFFSKVLLIPPGVTPATTMEVLQALPMALLTGSAFYHLWYIPVLVILFVLTPLFSVLLAKRSLLPLVAILLLVPLICSRVWPDFSFKSVLFFVGPYLGGMLIGTYYEKTLQLIPNYKWTLWASIFVTTLPLYYFYYQGTEEIYGVSLQESFGYIQKMCITLLAIDMLRRRESKTPKLFTVLGDYAFSIYFIHTFFTACFSIAAILLLLPQNAGVLTLLGFGFGIFLLSMGLSMGLTWLIKKILGRYSKFVIGA